MNESRCGRCGAPLALADTVCAACGETVATAQRFSLLASRAERLAGDGLYAEAARAAEGVLALPLEPSDAKAWWRKRAAWLQKADPDLRSKGWDAAEAALLQSVRLDDHDDLSHQLWIDLLHRRSRLDLARKEYQRRLELNAGDAVARRHLGSLRLMEDLKSAPLPKLELPPQKDGLLLRIFKPTPGKMVTAAVGLLSCLYLLFQSWSAGAAGPTLPQGAESMASVIKLADDPWLNVAQILLYGAYLVWGWRARHDA